MEISADIVKDLRVKTGAGIMDCKEALKVAGGNFEKAIDFLREKGLSAATKKSSRATKDGLVTSYIHMGGKVGVMIEVNCETDFVAKTEDFKTLTRDLAMHVAAMNPLYVKPDDVPEAALQREKDIYRKQVIAEGKPEKIADKIVEGKLKKILRGSLSREAEVHQGHEPDGGGPHQGSHRQDGREHPREAFCALPARRRRVLGNAL